MVVNYVHEKAVVEGDVLLGENVFIDAFAFVKGDEGRIEIGGNSNLQDHVSVHGENVIIGSQVTVGHSAVLHGCRIADNVLIGMAAVVLDKAEVGEWSVIAAGALIPPGKKIPAFSVVMGSPGKVVRQVTEGDKRLIEDSWKNYVKKLKQE